MGKPQIQKPQRGDMFVEPVEKWLLTLSKYKIYTIWQINSYLDDKNGFISQLCCFDVLILRINYKDWATTLPGGIII